MNIHQQNVLSAQMRAIHHATRAHGMGLPVSSTVTGLMTHGGLYTLLDPDIMTARMGALLDASTSETSTATMVPNIQAAVATFFKRLVPNKPYLIPSSLMSYLVLPHEGQTYTEDGDEEQHPKKYESADIPAVFTFVGQFIDHDLTMNAVNLFEPQTGPIPDGASPLIDLDSVYGPRSALASPTDTIIKNGAFILSGSLPAIDLPRDPATGKAFIADQRNDENQMILQIHLLVQSMHNKFLGNKGQAGFDDAQRETILNWQYMILHDYLPRIIQKETLDLVMSEITKQDFGDIKIKPCKDLGTGQYLFSMPHEFAIGFRFGHSQLKRGYKLNGSFPGSLLFDNELVGRGQNGSDFDDLRGSQTLRDKNRIDWKVFYPKQDAVLSNRIDGKVTAKVFDLPESAVPDDIKYIGNLAHRNLIRSRQIGLCSGEDLAEFLGIHKDKRVSEDGIEPSPVRKPLFKHNEATGLPSPQPFQTPLWYYLLKEAEHFNGDGKDRSKLGPVGSRLVAEVLVGAIRYAPISVFETKFNPLPGPKEDHLRNIIRWVYGLSDF